jgi:hypothetical protein
MIHIVSANCTIYMDVVWGEIKGRLAIKIERAEKDE